MFTLNPQQLLDCLTERTCHYLDDLRLATSAAPPRSCPKGHCPPIETHLVALTLKHTHYGGVWIGYSFDTPLLQEIMQRYLAGLSYDSHEVALYLKETAKDMINELVGNATADVAQQGEALQLSLPTLLSGAERFENSDLPEQYCYQQLTISDYGQMTLWTGLIP
ncbi:hypothetical protein D5085_02950 [Ectothiorhodospiraceae bacterium BW-2]|nr:hypothetical protein D5085_02950 [Ectothiorhodospiraceae bacterium BW-2]